MTFLSSPLGVDDRDREVRDVPWRRRLIVRGDGRRRIVVEEGDPWKIVEGGRAERTGDDAALGLLAVALAGWRRRGGRSGVDMGKLVKEVVMCSSPFDRATGWRDCRLGRAEVSVAFQDREERGYALKEREQRSPLECELETKDEYERCVEASVGWSVSGRGLKGQTMCSLFGNA